MDFIEKIFHVAPDGGNGLVELSIVLGFLTLIAAFFVFLTKRRSEIVRRLGHMLESEHSETSEMNRLGVSSPDRMFRN